MNATHLYPAQCAAQKVLQVLIGGPPACAHEHQHGRVVRGARASAPPVWRGARFAWSGIDLRCGPSRVASGFSEGSHPPPPLPHPSDPPPPATPIAPGTPSGPSLPTEDGDDARGASREDAPTPYCSCRIVSATFASSHRSSSFVFRPRPSLLSNADRRRRRRCRASPGTAMGQSRVAMPPSHAGTSRWYSMSKFWRNRDTAIVHACLLRSRSTASYGSENRGHEAERGALPGRRVRPRPAAIGASPATGAPRASRRRRPARRHRGAHGAVEQAAHRERARGRERRRGRETRGGARARTGDEGAAGRLWTSGSGGAERRRGHDRPGGARGERGERGPLRRGGECATRRAARPAEAGPRA